MKKKYVHTTNVHNLVAPQKIVKEILKYFSPKSIVDIGCGLWTFVKIFQDSWIEITHWVDWTWVNKELLHISQKDFFEKDLEKYHNFDKKYDLALSLEVAEHLSPDSAENFVKTLTSASDYIIFSAALPNQWGQNHINEQTPMYWEKLFNKQWYKMYDVFRHIFWEDQDIFWRYKQNMFLILKEWINLPTGLEEKTPRYIIHPELYQEAKNSLNSPYKAIIYGLYLTKEKIINLFK